MADRSETGEEPQAAPSGKKGDDFRKITEEERTEILERHAEWLASNGERGIRADLRQAHLFEADLVSCRLQGANLQGAYLENANLRQANLEEAKLENAYLAEANLENARLGRADLRTAILWQANLLNAGLRKADLRGAQLHKARLLSADLREADIRGADLHGAAFNGAKLQNADLTTANLQHARFEHLKDTEGALLVPAADLKGVSFRNADLSDAALSDVTGLQAAQLAGSNLSSARLPDDIKQFEALEHVAEISKHARNIFLGVVGACVYSWLSIATTTDIALITGSTATPLPIIQTPVSIAGFYWAAPPILFVLYVYLHLYLQRMWEGMAELPAIFPDGRSLDQRVYPWLLSGLVAANIALLKERRPPSSWLQVGLSVIAAWGLVPFTLSLFWARYLVRHDWPWTIWHIVLFVAAAAYGLASYRLAKATLGGEPPADQGIIGSGKRPEPRQFFQALRHYENLWLLPFVPMTFLLSYLAIQGLPVATYRDSLAPPPWLYASLANADISTKPANWTGFEENAKAELAQVKGADLWGANLRGAAATGAFLAKADLTGADLRYASLIGADLRGATLSKARLQSALLLGADLQGARLNGTDLHAAIFLKAKLQGTDLEDSKNLTQRQLDSACGDQGTTLPPGLTIKTCQKEGAEAPAGESDPTR